MNAGEFFGQVGDGLDLREQVGQPGIGAADLPDPLHVFQDADGGLEAIAADEAVAGIADIGAHRGAGAGAAHVAQIDQLAQLVGGNLLALAALAIIETEQPREE